MPRKISFITKTIYNATKIKKARSLLITTELSISIIASSLGFDDQLAFLRTFKKEFSISPSMYRKYYAEK
ncbi:helix-turn-helix domain-containing protein [Megamonas funiformis]|uniref:helix-turn-helix domain-containing protein n=1 Tax=Megamonas funiformis TaxID=437897 RepID=UPI000E3F10AB|nr:helix-turn-helix domain-containing protein [Megamonas funiformis]